MGATALRAVPNENRPRPTTIPHTTVAFNHSMISAHSKVIVLGNATRLTEPWHPSNRRPTGARPPPCDSQFNRATPAQPAPSPTRSPSSSTARPCVNLRNQGSLGITPSGSLTQDFLHARTNQRRTHIDGEASCRYATQPTSRSGHPAIAAATCTNRRVRRTSPNWADAKFRRAHDSTSMPHMRHHNHQPP